MKIKIKKYDEHRNQYNGEIKGVNIVFDPFVSGILNGDKHDREKIDSLINKEIEIDIWQHAGGCWLLTSEGEKQFESLID